MTYFSDTVQGERARTLEEIDRAAWGGIRALIGSRIEDGSFGMSYPNGCPDGRGPYGTNEPNFWSALVAEVPNLADRDSWHDQTNLPTTLDILDIVEFAWRTIAKPIERDFHSFFGHTHLSFDRDAGRIAFRDDVERILRRGGFAYELGIDGRIRRLAPPVLLEALSAADFQSPDIELSKMLTLARNKFFDPDLVVRREALEKLWDAWERLKTLGVGEDKKAQVRNILDYVAGPSSQFRQALENEAKELTAVGNKLQIRHFEIGREIISNSTHVDYLVHRLMALIMMILRTKWS